MTEKKKEKVQKKVRRQKPDALARAQADVDAAKVAPPEEPSPAEEANALREPERRHAEILANAAAVPTPGPLADLPQAALHELRMTDLSSSSRRTLAGLASKLHRASSQIDAFEEDPTIPEDARAPAGTRDLVRRGLVVERRAYFVTELGARVVANAGIEVTRSTCEPAKVAS